MKSSHILYLRGPRCQHTSSAFQSCCHAEAGSRQGPALLLPLPSHGGVMVEPLPSHGGVLLLHCSQATAPQPPARPPQAMFLCCWPGRGQSSCTAPGTTGQPMASGQYLSCRLLQSPPNLLWSTTCLPSWSWQTRYMNHVLHSTATVCQTRSGTVLGLS